MQGETPMSTIQSATLAILAAAALASAPAAATKGATALRATLTGAAETQPAAADGTGTFQGHVNPAKGQLCYTLTSAGLDSLTMAHIHAGATGVAGPPVVVLSADAAKETCMAVDKDVAAKLVASPGDYYVNIHTAIYPKGAVRGQLTK